MKPGYRVVILALPRNSNRRIYGYRGTVRTVRVEGCRTPVVEIAVEQLGATALRHLARTFGVMAARMATDVAKGRR